MALFKIEPPSKQQNIDKSINMKMKKNDSILRLIEQAEKLVNEKLGNYKEASECVLDFDTLDKFFSETTGIIATDTETTGLNVLTDEIVGFSLCNGKQSLYIPLNHKSPIYNERLNVQLDVNKVREYLLNIIHTRKDLKWVYHNAKFDLGVFRTYLGEQMPEPYWDTLLGSQLLYQSEEHSLKFQYNKYIAEEDERC